jgi:hypothetical protein
MLIARAGVAVAAAGALVFDRAGGEQGRLGGPLLFILGQLIAIYAMYKTITDRANRFAAASIPPEWTRTPLRGVTDTDLQRWENTIRELRQPWPGDAILLAARARAEDLSLIIAVGVLPAVIAVVRLVLVLREPGSVMTPFVVPHVILGLLLCLVAFRYAVNGRRAYLARYGAR